MNTRIIGLLKEIKQMLQGTDSTNRWIDIAEASQYSGVSRATLRRNVASGKLKCSNVTGKSLFRIADVERWLTNG